MILRNSCLWASQKELTNDVTEYLLIVLMSFAILEDFPIKPIHLRSTAERQFRIRHPIRDPSKVWSQRQATQPFITEDPRQKKTGEATENSKRLALPKYHTP
jgi:hypothetical protein